MIKVTIKDGERQFPFRVELGNDYVRYLTLKAAIELRQKLDRTISEYQIAEAKEAELPACKECGVRGCNGECMGE